MRLLSAVLTVCLAAAIVAAADSLSIKNKLRVITGNFPDQTDAAVDAQGRVHVVYGLAKKQQAYYLMYSAVSDKPTAVIPINGKMEIVVGHERGPKVAVGRKNAIYVLWQSSDGLLCVRSAEHGSAAKFEPVKVTDADTPIDVPNISSDDRGTVYAVWVDHRHKTGDALGAELYMAWTDEEGRFGANAKVSDDAYPVCPCCMPEIQCCGDHIYVLYRSSKEGVKEMVLRHADRRRRQWATAVISKDAWKFEGCPMSGGKLAAVGERVVVTWASAGKYFVSDSNNGGKSFSSQREIRSVRRLPLPTVDTLFAEGEALDVNTLKREPPASAGPVGRVVSIGRHGSAADSLVILRSTAEPMVH